MPGPAWPLRGFGKVKLQAAKIPTPGVLSRVQMAWAPCMRAELPLRSALGYWRNRAIGSVTPALNILYDAWDICRITYDTLFYIYYRDI